MQYCDDDFLRNLNWDLSFFLIPVSFDIFAWQRIRLHVANIFWISMRYCPLWSVQEKYKGAFEKLGCNYTTVSYINKKLDMCAKLSERRVRKFHCLF